MTNSLALRNKGIWGNSFSQFVWDWHKESHSLGWEMVTRRVPKPHKAPPLLFTSTQDSFHRNRGQSHLKQISRPFESKRLPRTHGWLEISPQNKTLWDQTVPNFATLWWLWLFNIHGKVGQTFFICSPLIKATMHVIIFHSIFTPSSPTSSLSKSKPWAARSTVST